MKSCNKCNQPKELIEFYKLSRNNDKLDTYCKICRNQHNKTYRENNPEIIKAGTKRRYYKDIEKSRKSRQKNASKPEHKELKRLYDLNYREDNKEKITGYKKRWADKNKNNPIHKIKRNLRRRIHHVIADGYKSDSTQNLLGCSFEEFKSYLESKFLPNMTWENYGLGQDKWHIDHIRPCCDFDLLKEEEQRKCFHYSNLQPLWEKDNLKKSYIFNGKNCRIK